MMYGKELPKRKMLTEDEMEEVAGLIYIGTVWYGLDELWCFALTSSESEGNKLAYSSREACGMKLSA